jgi:putative two-component system response regulator
VKERILFVDDEPNVLSAHRRELRKKFDVETATSAEEGLKIVAAHGPFAVIVSDYRMPQGDGNRFLAAVKNIAPDSVRVMLTGYADIDMAMRAINDGSVFRFLTKPCAADTLGNTLTAAVQQYRLVTAEKELLAARTHELRTALQKVRIASLDTIYRLARAAEYRDQDTGAHLTRMSHYAVRVARKLGLDDRTAEAILHAAPMHDVGKIGIPDRILLKPGKLDPDEWNIMKQHTVIGARILEGSRADVIKLGRLIALTHHERWDGGGYPKNLKGAGIPLPGRITAIADEFDALTSKRPYKPAFSLEKSFDIIAQGRASKFDPDVVDAFFEAQGEILAIKERYKDEPLIGSCPVRASKDGIPWSGKNDTCQKYACGKKNIPPSEQS